MQLYLYILLIFFQLHSSQQIDIAGEYQNCPFHCLTITIDSNNAFEYRLFGDMFNGEGSIGSLLPLGNSEFLANSFVQPYQLEEYITESTFSVINIQYDFEEPASFIPVEINCVDSIYKTATDKNGLIRLKKSQIFGIDIKGVGTDVQYIPRIDSADSFYIKIRFDPKLIYITNEKWFVDENSLYFWNDKENAYDKDFVLNKISP